MFIILLGPEAFTFMSLTSALVAEQAPALLTVAEETEGMSLSTEAWLLEASEVEEIDSSHWWSGVITVSQFTQFTPAGGGRGALQLVLATSPIPVSGEKQLSPLKAASANFSVFPGITETTAAVEAVSTSAVLAGRMGEDCSVAAACLGAALKAAVRSLLRSLSAGPR